MEDALFCVQKEVIMPIYKRCSYCGKRISSGTVCTCVKRRHKEYDQAKDKEIKGFYSSRSWQVVRQKAIGRYSQLDLISYFEDNQIVYGETVHHIIPIKEDWTKRYELDNLIYITEQHHQQLHEAMKAGKAKEVQQYLYALIARWNEEMNCQKK